VRHINVFLAIGNLWSIILVGTRKNRLIAFVRNPCGENAVGIFFVRSCSQNIQSCSKILKFLKF
jgi:hypothetical protein